MPSELYVQVPATYGSFAYAGMDSPTLNLAGYGRDAGILLHLHLLTVLYCKRWRLLDGVVPGAVIRHLTLPASARTAKRDIQRLVKAGFLEPREDDHFFVPAAVEWQVLRTGTRDPIPGFIRSRIYERDGWRCAECGSAEDLTLDHIIPWSLNGPDKEENLRTLCGPCNSSKGART